MLQQLCFCLFFDPLAKINLVPKLLPLSQEVARGQRNYFQILLLLGHVMCYVCFVVAMAFAAQELVLEVLQALTSNTQIVKETMQKGMQQPPSKPGFLFQNLSHRKIGRKHDPETLKPKAFVSQMLRKIEKKKKTHDSLPLCKSQVGILGDIQSSETMPWCWPRPQA